MECPFDLSRAYRDGCLLPFVGAGVPMSVSWKDAETGEDRRGPSWEELVDRAAHILGFEDAGLLRCRGTDQQILEYFQRKHSGQVAKLTNWLTKYMSPSESDLKASSVLQEICALSNCNLFYTTNFDDFLERALRINGRSPNVIAIEAEMGGLDRRCEVIKFHGDLDHPNQIVLTEGDYERRLSLTEHLDLRLKADLLGRVVLFIGYSFRDPNVSYLFRMFQDQLHTDSGARSGARAFITIPDPSDFERTLFEARGIQVIPIRGSHLSADTAKLLSLIRD